MISYHEALDIIHSFQLLEPTIVPLEQAVGTATVDAIRSPMCVPSFRNSAMDGFAVCAADIRDALSNSPITLPVIASIAAGDNPCRGRRGATSEIMTGAVIPEPYNAVVPLESVTVSRSDAGLPAFVQFTDAATVRSNVRLPGEDLTSGQTIVRPHVMIAPAHVMALAAAGIHQLTVRRAPPLHVFATGKEVTDRYDAPPAEGRVFNSSAPYLLACAAEEGLPAHYGGIIADHPTHFLKALETVPVGSLIISTGAVSKGRWDFIPEALRQRGATIHFHSVGIRPGKPILFATLEDGSHFFGLPGNPISTAVGFRFFVLPFIDALLGLPPELPLFARLDSAHAKTNRLRQFLKSQMWCAPDGILRTQISGGQESFKVSPMMRCNSWVIAEEDRSQFDAEELVPVMPFSRRFNMSLATRSHTEDPVDFHPPRRQGVVT